MEPITTSSRVNYQDENGRTRSREQMFRSSCLWIREALAEITQPQLEQDLSSIDIKVRADSQGWLITTRTT